MIYGFARRSGGQVRVYAEVGQGTTMGLSLPRHDGAATGEPAGSSVTSDDPKQVPTVAGLG